MLVNFPLEILLNVVHRLDLHDKITLTTTCHKLGSLIAENCLYETLNLKDRNVTDTVIKRFKNKELHGSQVRHLKLCFDVLSDDIYRQLPDIFPRVIRLVNHSDTEGPRDHYTVRELLKWKDTLQYYDVRDCLFKLARLIEKNTFSQLKHLRLSTFFSLDLAMYKTDLQLLKCIAHAPFIETLELYLCQIDINFLESVHNSCPYLKTLSLQNVLLAFLGDESLPETIVPASSLICFKLDSVSIICDANCVLPGYILRKYPNLQTLELLPATDSGDLAGMLREFHILGEEEEPIDNPVTFPYTQGHNATWVRYRNDGLQFIDRLPRSITTLKLYEEMFVDIVFGIQAAGLQLSTLELYSDIRRSAGTNVFEQDEDMLFLESQTSLKTLQFATYSLIQYLNPPIVSSSVTQLQLYLPFTSHCSPICIAWVLSAFPAIEKLDIVSEDALCRADMSAYKPNYNLIELNLNRTLTSPTILNMIGSLAPNIRHLAYSLNEVGSDKTMLDSKRHLYNYPITTNEDDGTAYYHVDVTNFDLDTFRLTCNLGKDIVTGEIDIYYEIVNENQVKRFIVSSGHKPLTVVRDKNSPHLTMMTKVRVSCKKIIKLIIDNKTLVTFKDNAISLDL